MASAGAAPRELCCDAEGAKYTESFQTFRDPTDGRSHESLALFHRRVLDTVKTRIVAVEPVVAVLEARSLFAAADAAA